MTQKQFNNAQIVYSTNYFYIAAVASMLNDTAHKLPLAASEEGCYRQETKQHIKRITQNASALMHRVRLMEHFVAAALCFPDLKFWRQEYGAGDLSYTAQYAIQQATAKQFTIFSATCQNLAHRVGTKHPHTFALVLVVNGLAEIMRSFKEVVTKVYSSYGMLQPYDPLAECYNRMQNATRKLMDGMLNVPEDKGERWMQQAQQALNQLSEAVLNFLGDDMRPVVSEAKRMMAGWYFGRCIKEQHEKGKLPDEVKKELRALYGADRSPQLFRMITFAARDWCIFDDPLDLWEVASARYPTLAQAVEEVANDFNK